ncbi:hypothetical protein SRABI106_02776 [Rahnella aquatilis]|nr:hypothetical protein SRABI106_02776 [Rahnella aquatilis]
MEYRYPSQSEPLTNAVKHLYCSPVIEFVQPKIFHVQGVPRNYHFLVLASLHLHVLSDGAGTGTRRHTLFHPHLLWSYPLEKKAEKVEPHGGCNL